MGRASRLKDNPDRVRYQSERAAKPTLSEPSEQFYRTDGSKSHDELVQTAAIHEAGHVVAALALGLKVGYSIVSVREDGKNRFVGGYTETHFGTFDTKEEADKASAGLLTPEMLRIRAVQGLGGQVGESCFNKNQADIEAGATNDDREVMKLALYATGRTASSSNADSVSATDYFNERLREAVDLIRAKKIPLWRVTNYLLAHVNEKAPGDVLAGLMSEELSEGETK